MIKGLLLAVLVGVAVCQSAQQKQSKRQSEKDISMSVGIAYENSESISFISNSMDDFVLQHSQKEQIKGTVMILWRVDDVYMTSEYTLGEQVRLLIYENNTSIIFDRTFYTGTGFAFPSKKDTKYLLRFTATGAYNKLIGFTVSKNIPKTQAIAGIQDLQNSQHRSEGLLASLKVMVQFSERNSIFTSQVSESIRENTRKYMNFGIFEAILIIVITFIQVTYISKLVKTDSIV